MLANVGFFTLVMTFVVALYGAGAAAYGSLRRRPDLIESARHAMLLTFPLLTVASGCLIALLVSGGFDIEYVASTTSLAMPTYLKITAWWGGQAGSLLFWSWLMAAFTTAATPAQLGSRPRVPALGHRRDHGHAGLLPQPGGLLREPLRPAVDDLRRAAGQRPCSSPPAPCRSSRPTGSGLNPLLRHPGMIIHPPMLYLGFVAFVIPFAFAMAALITGRTDDRWIRITRRWTLIAWLFLSLGLILGRRWAYDVLGLGRLLGLGSGGDRRLHALADRHGLPAFGDVQEKRGMLKHWNMVLIILTYAPGHLRHLPDALGRAFLGARLRPVAPSGRCSSPSSG